MRADRPYCQPEPAQLGPPRAARPTDEDSSWPIPRSATRSRPGVPRVAPERTGWCGGTTGGTRQGARPGPTTALPGPTPDARKVGAKPPWVLKASVAVAEVAVVLLGARITSSANGATVGPVGPVGRFGRNGLDARGAALSETPFSANRSETSSRSMIPHGWHGSAAVRRWLRFWTTETSRLRQKDKTAID